MPNLFFFSLKIVFIVTKPSRQAGACSALAGGGRAGEQLLQAPLDLLQAAVGTLQAPGQAAAGLQIQLQQARTAGDHRADRARGDPGAPEVQGAQCWWGAIWGDQEGGQGLLQVLLTEALAAQVQLTQGA